MAASLPRVAIAGAGLAGLTLALALLRRGFAVQVFEQAPVLGDVGAGLQLSPNATRCLHALGLAPALERVASAPRGKQVRLWNTGQRWKLFDLGVAAVAEYGFPYLTLHRADLHAVLVDAVRALDPSCIHLGMACTGFTQDASLATRSSPPMACTRCCAPSSVMPTSRSSPVARPGAD